MPNLLSLYSEHGGVDAAATQMADMRAHGFLGVFTALPCVPLRVMPRGMVAKKGTTELRVAAASRFAPEQGSWLQRAEGVRLSAERLAALPSEGRHLCRSPGRRTCSPACSPSTTRSPSVPSTLTASTRRSSRRWASRASSTTAPEARAAPSLGRPRACCRHARHPPAPWASRPPARARAANNTGARPRARAPATWPTRAPRAAQ